MDDINAIRKQLLGAGLVENRVERGEGQGRQLGAAGDLTCFNPAASSAGIFIINAEPGELRSSTSSAQSTSEARRAWRNPGNPEQVGNVVR